MVGIKPVHPFPARMAPSLAMRALPNSMPSLRVLDPMAGSGTTLVAARTLGHKAIGYDVDPLAVLVARAWCSDIDECDLLVKGRQVLDRARQRFRRMRVAEAYPPRADEETRRLVRYWFDGYSRRQLASLAHSIAAVRNELLRTLLWCALSRLVITKNAGVSLAMDVSHSRPHRAFDRAPVKPFSKFMAAVGLVAARAPFKGQEPTMPDAVVRQGDARALEIGDHTVDMVVTSPPYLNAIDYMRGHKLSLVWMGHAAGDLRALRSRSIGSEVAAPSEVKSKRHVKAALSKMGAIDGLAARFQGMLARYAYDMDLVLGEMSRVLVPGGQAVVVVGNSTIRGVFVSNSKAIAFLSRRRGLSVEAVTSRPIPDSRRYLPPPTHKAAGARLRRRMREEVVLALRAECGRSTA